MSLTKKHLKELASIVRESACDVANIESCSDCVRTLADQLGVFCAKHNPNFDRERFLKACEPKGDVS